MTTAAHVPPRTLHLVTDVGAIAASAGDFAACLTAVARACVPEFATGAALRMPGQLPSVVAGEVEPAHLGPSEPGDERRIAVLAGDGAILLVRSTDRPAFDAADARVAGAIERILASAVERLTGTGGDRGPSSISNTLFETAFDLSPLVLTITDARTGELIEVNAAFTEATGIPRDEAIGRTPVELGLWVDPQDRERGLADLRQGRTVRDHEARFNTRDRGVIDCLISGSLVIIDGRACMLSAIKDVTERKRASDILARYRLLAEHTRDILLFMNPQGRIVEANAAAVAAYGYAAEELIGMSIVDLRAPNAVSELSGQFSQALAAGIRFETWHRRKDGSTFPVEVDAQSGSSGSEQLVLSVIRDVTERKRTEEALRTSEERLRLAVDAAGLRTWESYLHPDDGLELEVQRAGHAPVPRPLDSVLRVIHPDDRERIKQAAIHAIATGGEFAEEFRRILPSGEVRWLSSRGRAFPASEGRSPRLLGVSADITAERVAATALAASEARFRDLAEAMPQLVWTAGPDGGFDYLNEQWREYVGRPLDELLGAGWHAAIHPDDRDRAVAAWSAAVAGETLGFDAEMRLRRFDGVYRWFKSRAVPSVDESGAVVKWYGSNTDIDDLKQAEVRRNELIDTLAHDLKNPLAAIKAQAQALRRKVVRGDTLQPEPLDMLADTATRMAELIDEMGDATNLAAGGEIELDLQPGDLVEVARNAVATYGRMSTRHSLVLLAPDEPVRGVFDRQRLERVLGNLLANAIKYSPDGGRIVVAVAAIEQYGAPWGTVSVRDQGIGIPAADLPHIFQRRHRGTNVGRIVGTGLGLAGAADVVRLHHGELTVDSQEGAGSTFTVAIPLAIDPS